MRRGILYKVGMFVGEMEGGTYMMCRRGEAYIQNRAQHVLTEANNHTLGKQFLLGRLKA